MAKKESKILLQKIVSVLRDRYSQEDLINAYKNARSLVETSSIESEAKILEGLEVALIAIQEMGLGLKSLLSVILYKGMKASVLSIDNVDKIMGSEVALLLEQLRKTSELYTKTRAFSSENFHNLLLNIAEDIRVILLIIADRLFTLRHAKSLDKDEDRLALALEVYHLYAPIAHRLGLYKIKGELEDLSFKYRDRKTFDYIKRKLGETKDERDAYIESFINPLKNILDTQLNIPYSIKGRTKSISSISNKLKKHKAFEDIYDLFAIRIILDVPKELERQYCWQIYSIVTDMYIPNPERMKDWISIPKSNGYESLHTTVLGPNNKWVEVQIRTKRMDEIAERGVAAHWKYKGLKSQSGLDEFLNSVREMLELIRESGGDGYLQNVFSSSMMTLKSEEIYVFTPKGEVVKLPRGATVLDFAFAIHSKVGSSSVGAKVNDRNVSIKYQLKNGDVVQVLTSSQQTPKNDWLNIVVSPRAKNRIRQILRSEEEAGLAVAKETMQRRFKNRKLVFNDALFIKLIKSLGFKTITDFYRNILQDKVDINNFLDSYEILLQKDDKENDLKRDIVSHKSADQFISDFTEESSTVSRSGDIIFKETGMQGVEYTFAKCCNPVFGDKIFAFISSRSIKIHRMDCPNAPSMFENSAPRILMAEWNGGVTNKHIASLEVIGNDDISIVNTITSFIQKEKGVKIRSYKIDSADGLFRGSFTIFVENKSQLTSIIKKISGIAGVKNVIRL